MTIGVPCVTKPRKIYTEIKRMRDLDGGERAEKSVGKRKTAREI